MTGWTIAAIVVGVPAALAVGYGIYTAVAAPVPGVVMPPSSSPSTGPLATLEQIGANAGNTLMNLVNGLDSTANVQKLSPVPGLTMPGN